MVIITTFLLVISIAAVVILLFKYEWSDEIRYLGVRASFTVFGISIFLFGICFFQRGWFMSAFFGVLLLITGIQITLWSVGISMDFLANAPTILNEEFDIKLLFGGKLEPTFNVESHSVARSILVHLQIAIRVLQYMKETEKVENQGDALIAVREEIEEILDIIKNNVSLLPLYVSDDFVTSSSVFRFGSLNTAIDNLPVLERLRDEISRFV